MPLDRIKIRSIFFVYLIFQSFILGKLFPQMSMATSLIIPSIPFLITLVILNPLKIDKFLFFASIISTFSMIIGLLSGWYLIDIIGDTYRYITPFVAFAVGLKILEKLNKEEIVILIKLILSIHIIIFLFSMYEFLQLDINSNLFNYSDRININISHVLFLFFFINFINKPLNLTSTIFFLLILPFFVLSMLINLSKLSFILMVIYFIAPLFIYKKHLINIVLLLIALLFLFLSYDIVSDRINPMIEVIRVYLFEREISTLDTSTTARLLETTNVFQSVLSNPFNLFFGNGSGALIMDIDIENSGISPFNVRDNGGIHHIHIEYISLIFRNGIVGLMLYFYWKVYIINSALKMSKYVKEKESILAIFTLAIGILFLSYIFVSLTNNAIYGKLIIGLYAALAIKISGIYKKL